MDDPATIEDAADRLEEDMRRYIFDRTPERRRACLDQYRERRGLMPWAAFQQWKQQWKDM